MSAQYVKAKFISHHLQQVCELLRKAIEEGHTTVYLIHQIKPTSRFVVETGGNSTVADIHHDDFPEIAAVILQLQILHDQKPEKSAFEVIDMHQIRGSYSRWVFQLRLDLEEPEEKLRCLDKMCEEIIRGSK